ncbi:MAG: hypothetical protein ACM3SW_01980 [Actinomycetota bacterium]
MHVWVLSAMARRMLAALWFGLFGFLSGSVFFLRPGVRFSVLFLYVLLPALAASIAGCIWGGAVLDARTTNHASQAVLRGVGVTVGAFVIYAALYALGLPLVEPGWGLKQAGGIMVLVLTLGPLMVAPVILIAGMIGGATLYVLGRRALVERDGQADHTNI